MKIQLAKNQLPPSDLPDPGKLDNVLHTIGYGDIYRNTLSRGFHDTANRGSTPARVLVCRSSMLVRLPDLPALISGLATKKQMAFCQSN
jgi:hypothetical protein